MSVEIIVYGAYGFTGRLVTEALIARGIRPRLAGRNADRLQAVARDLGCDWTAADIDDADALRALLAPSFAVLHCAGPFIDTSAQMVQACLDTGTHYVDITGEPPVFEACHARDGAARERQIMLLPGGGFDVVPTDCVAGMLKQRLPDATHLRLAFASSGGFSHGTMRTAGRSLADPTWVRREGRLVGRAENDSRMIDFGAGPREVLPITWGDIMTAWYSTGIPNIEVYSAASEAARSLLRMPSLLKRFLASRLGAPILERQIRKLPPGPSAEARVSGSAVVYGRASNAAGQSVELRLRTLEAYRLTAEMMAEIASRILGGAAPIGYQTPATAYGAELVMALDRTTLVDP